MAAIRKEYGPQRREGSKHKADTEGTAYTVDSRGALPRDVIKVSALAGGKGTKERAFLCRTCDKVYDGPELKAHKGHQIVKHPTQKPFELTERLLKAAQTEWGLVVVPFVGSGSELKVVRELDMDCVGFEINPDYIRIANKLLGETK